LASRSDGSTLYFYFGLKKQSVVTNNFLAGGSGATLRAHGNAGKPVSLLVAHNTIVNSAVGTGVLIGESATATLTNNIVAGHATAIRVEGTGVALADHTLFWNNSDDGVRGTDPIDGDPLFVNAPAGDFHIQGGSAAIGAGIDAGVAADIDGEARPGLGGVDVGADELAPSRFDFGTPGSPVEAGDAQVTHETTFTAERGFGWTYGTIASRDRGAANDNRRRDFCFTHTGTFAVAIPNGRYWVTLIMGDAAAGHGQMAVFLENVKAAVVSTAGNEFKTMTFDTAVTDGRLDVWLNDEGGSDPNAVINSLMIKPALPVMVDLGTAASPVAAGYARGTHTSAYSAGAAFGWRGGLLQSRDRGTADALKRDLVFTPRGLTGAFLPNGIYDVLVTMGDAAGAHNLMGVSVQGSAFDQVSTAKNQFVIRRYRTAVADNRLDVLLDDLEGPDLNTVLNAVEVLPSFVPRFDFGTQTSAVGSGYLQVTHTTAYSARLGYGWTAGTIGSRDRGGPWNIRYRDFNFTTDGTFAVDVLPGRYQVTVGVGDSTASHDQFAIEIEGTRVETFTSLPAGSSLTRTYGLSVLDGQLTVRLVDTGGTDPNAVINVLEIR
jgi:fibronectin type 3 domain-containing protein